MIYREALRSGKPIFCIEDDTISSKTKPSSRALHPIEDAFVKRGFYTIGALKTNRILYPGGIKQKVSEFALHLRKTDAAVSLVTVTGKKIQKQSGINPEVCVQHTENRHAVKILWRNHDRSNG